MKVSIITVVYNNVATIGKAIESVLSQTYPDIEYIIVDGASTDGTVDIIKKYSSRIKFVSEKDEGLYDAMNKGILIATGDIVGILNSDDIFFNTEVIASIVSGFQNSDIDAVIADIVFVKASDNNKILRRYSASSWSPKKFAWGYMPPHPSFFVKSEQLLRLGLYKTNYKIAADYELLIRFLLVNHLRYKYLPIITTKMLLGGKSTQGIKSILTLNREILRACKQNSIYTNYFMIYSKYLFKSLEFIFHD